MSSYNTKTETTIIAFKNTPIIRYIDNIAKFQNKRKYIEHTSINKIKRIHLYIAELQTPTKHTNKIINN